MDLCTGCVSSNMICHREFIVFGRTGQRVTKIGLECGRFSCLDQRYGRSESHSIEVVRSAIDLDINYIDTAASYSTESIVGKAIRGLDRERLYLSMKFKLDGIQQDGLLLEQWITRSLETSLARIQPTDATHMLNRSLEAAIESGGRPSSSQCPLRVGS